MSNHTSKPLRALSTIGEGAKFRRAPGKGRETFGAALKRMNKEHGITAKDLGMTCSVPPAVVKGWEDETIAPTRSEFGKICRRHRQLRFFAPPSFLEPKVNEAPAPIDAIPPATLPVGSAEPKTFAESLRRERKAEGLSVKQLADSLDVEPEVVDMWENDEADPDFQSMVSLAEVFPRLLRGPTPASLEEQCAEFEAEMEAKAAEKGASPGSYGRIGFVRKIAHVFLDSAATPADREERLKVLREELPRRERRVLRIPSPGAAEKAAEEAAKARAVEKRSELRECPRCHEKFLDLASHGPECPKRKVDWHKEGWRTCKRSRHPHTWNVRTGLHIGSGSHIVPSADVVLQTEDCPSHRSERVEAPRSPAPSEEYGSSKDDRDRDPASQDLLTAPDSEVPRVGSSERIAYELEAYAKHRDGLELVERCLVLADMLWPGEEPSFVLRAKKDGEWGAWISAPAGIRAQGKADNKIAAVRALADALRAEVTDRQRKVADLAKLLED